MKTQPPSLEKTLMVAIALLVFSPLCLGVFLRFCRKPLPHTDWLANRTLAGVTAEKPPASLSWKNVANASWQEGVAGKFDRSFAGRELMIRLTDEFYFRAFDFCTVKSAALTVGRDDVMFEERYLQEYCIDRPGPETLAAWVTDLKRFQEECERRGTPFVFLITPSKAAVYPEDIPAKWMQRRDPRPRAYDLMVPMLREAGVRFVDAHALLTTLKGHTLAPIFPKGGIHWGQEGAIATWNAVAASLREQGKPVRGIDDARLEITRFPSPIDADLERVMNLAIPWEYPVATADFHPVKTAQPLNVALIGSSFMWLLAEDMSRTGQFSEVSCFYYYKLAKEVVVEGRRNKVAEPVKSVDFAREIFAADCVVVEISEQQIAYPQNHLAAFLTDVLAHLPPAGVKARFLSEKYLECQWGEEVSFGSGDANEIRRACLSGFSDPELRHAWTDGPEAAIRVRTPPAERDVIFETRVGAYFKKGGTQEVEITANGEIVGYWSFTAPNIATRQLTIPAKLAHGGTLEIGFKIAHATSPQENGEGADSRLLGLSFEKMKLHPAATENGEMR